MDDTSLASELTLALMHMDLIRQHGEVRARKMYPPAALHLLEEQGLLADASAKGKTTVITDAGVQRAREMFEKYFRDVASTMPEEPETARWEGHTPDPEGVYEGYEEEALTTVQLKWVDVTMSLDVDDDDMFAWYFDTVEHRLIMVDDYPLMDEDPDDLNDFERERFMEQRALEEDVDGRFLELHLQFGADGWRRMDKFTRSIEPARVAEEFERAIHGRGAFRRFRDELHAHDLWDAWDKYESAHKLRELHGWFAAAGFRLIITDVPTPS